jgi:hypothetical protein
MVGVVVLHFREKPILGWNVAHLNPRFLDRKKVSEMVCHLKSWGLTLCRFNNVCAFSSR